MTSSRRQIAGLVPQPGQNGVPAISAARMVGDHSMSRQLLIPAFDDGLRRGACCSIGNLPLGIDGNVPCPHAHA